MPSPRSSVPLVLALVATFMGLETKSLLIGEAASSEMVEGARKLIEAEAAQGGAIRREHAIRTMHLGPNDVLAAVRLDFNDGVTAARVQHIVAGLTVDPSTLPRYSPGVPRSRHHGSGRAKVSCCARFVRRSH
jgi:hypothetical protein